MTMRATAHQSWARAGARHSLRGRAKTDGLALPTDERAIQVFNACACDACWRWDKKSSGRAAPL